MRCHRCHTKIEPGKRICPVCYTLVDKRRDSIKLAPSSGVRSNPFIDLSNMLRRINPKKYLALLLIAAIIAGFVFMVKCTSCSGCGSCTCSGESGSHADIRSINSAAPCREFFCNEVLYYVSGSKLVARAADGTESIKAQGNGITNVYSDGESIWYLQGGSIWVTPVEKPMTVSDDPNVMYASSCLLNPTASDSDAGVICVNGFALDDGNICYWGVNASGTNEIYVMPAAGGSIRRLHSGAGVFMQCYRGSVYYLSRDKSDFGNLYGISLATGVRTQMYERAVNYYAPCRGWLFIYTWENSAGVLHRVDISTLEEDKQWSIMELKGMAATDRWIYYYTYTETSGELYRISPDGSDNRKVFYDDSRIQLNGIAGDHFSVYINLGESAENRLADAVYYIINAESGDQFIAP